MHFKPLPFLTLFAIPSLIVLLVLGSWQWERYAIKRDAPPPVALEQERQDGIPAGLQPESDFLPVRLQGQWAGTSVPVYAVRDGIRGKRWFSALITSTGPVLVDTGWAPERVIPSPPQGPATVDGLIRRATKANDFTPDNDPATGAWYWPENPQLLPALKVSAPTPLAAHYVAVSTSDLDRDGTMEANPWADPGGASSIPAERHLGYALTWWGLAGALVGVYLALHGQRGRLRFGKAAS